MSIFNKKPKMSPEEKEIKEVEPIGKYTGLSLENFLKIFEYVKHTKKKWFTVSVEILSDIARVNVYGTDDDFSSVTFIEYIDFTLNDGDVNRWTWPDEKGNAVHHRNSTGYEWWNEYDENNHMIYSKNSFDEEEFVNTDCNNIGKAVSTTPLVSSFVEFDNSFNILSISSLDKL